MGAGRSYWEGDLSAKPWREGNSECPEKREQGQRPGHTARAGDSGGGGLPAGPSGPGESLASTWGFELSPWTGAGSSPLLRGPLDRCSRCLGASGQTQLLFFSSAALCPALVRGLQPLPQGFLSIFLGGFSIFSRQSRQKSDSLGLLSARP